MLIVILSVGDSDNFRYATLYSQSMSLSLIVDYTILQHSDGDGL